MMTRSGNKVRRKYIVVVKTVDGSLITRTMSFKPRIGSELTDGEVVEKVLNP